MEPRAYLESMMPDREMVDHFVRADDEEAVFDPELGRVMCNSGGSVFDADLGWVLCDSVRSDAVDGSRGFYHYRPDGARRVVNFPDEICRVHTYGNSFTHCDQVSDGETWQEVLAAHLQEPICNFGIGGYSVYQAYRRMRKVEPVTGADYSVLNVWDDDHFRNLDAWRSIRSGRRGRFTLPYLRVDAQNGRCEETDNICRTPEEVYRLCDPEFVWETYREDPVLRAVLARKVGAGVSPEAVAAVAEGFGMSVDQVAELLPSEQVVKLHTEAALFATRSVLELTEAFVQETGKRLMVILSFGRGHVAEALEGKPLFDQTFLDWLGTRDYPVIDLRDAFRAEYALFKADIKTYLDRYYIGHHTPAGNFFFAWAIKDRICEWLDPAPLPYR